MSLEAPRELYRHRQVARIDKDVVGEPGLRGRGDAAQELRAQQEALVRLALDDVAQAHQAGPAGQDLDLRGRVRRLKVHPAHDARR